MTPQDGLGIAIGDIFGAHILFRPDRISSMRGATERESVAWEDVRLIELDTPTTSWPVPALGDILLPLLAGLLVSIVETPEVRRFRVELFATGGVRVWELGSHHAVGYTRRSARLMERTVQYLHRNPEARGLLREPRLILERLPQR